MATLRSKVIRSSSITTGTMDPEIELSRARAELWQLEHQKLDFLNQMTLKRIEIEHWYETELRSLQVQYQSLSAQIDGAKTTIDQQFHQRMAELSRMKTEFESRIANQAHELMRAHWRDLQTLSEMQNNLFKAIECAFQKVIYKHTNAESEVANLTNILKACQSGNVELLRTLLPLGSHLKQPLTQCYPLHIAALQGSVDVVEFLLASGFIDCEWQGKSALDMACLGGHPGVVKHLSEQSSLQSEEFPFHPSWAPYCIEVPPKAKGTVEIYRGNTLFTSEAFDTQEQVQLFLDEGEYRCQLKINEEHCTTFPIRVKDISPFVDKTLVKESGKSITLKFRGPVTGEVSVKYHGETIETFRLDSNQYLIIDTDVQFDNISFITKRKNSNIFSHPTFSLSVSEWVANSNGTLSHVPQILTSGTYEMPVPPAKGYVEIWQPGSPGVRLQRTFDRSRLPQKIKEALRENWEGALKEKIPLNTSGATHLQAFVDGAAVGQQHVINVVPVSVYLKDFDWNYSVGEELKLNFRTQMSGRIEFWVDGRQEQVIELSDSKGVMLQLKSPGHYRVKSYFQDGLGQEIPCADQGFQVTAASILFDFPPQIEAWETFNCSFRIPFTGRVQLKRNYVDVRHWDLKSAETFSCILTEPGTAELSFKMTAPFESEYTVALRVSPGSCFRQPPAAEIPGWVPYSIDFKSALSGVLEITGNDKTRSLPFNQVKSLKVPVSQLGRFNLTFRIPHPETQKNYVETLSLQVQTGKLDLGLASETETWKTYNLAFPFPLSGSLTLKQGTKILWTKQFLEATTLPLFFTTSGKHNLEFRFTNPETGLEEVCEFSTECEAQDVFLEPFPKVIKTWEKEELRFKGPKSGRINVLRGGRLQRNANIFFQNQESIPLSFCKEGDVQLIVSLEDGDGKTKAVKKIDVEVQPQKAITLPDILHGGELIALPRALKGSVTLKQNGFQKTLQLEDAACLRISDLQPIELEFTYDNPENTRGIHTLENPAVFTERFVFEPQSLKGKARLQGKTLEVSFGALRGQMVYQGHRLLMPQGLMPSDVKAPVYHQLLTHNLDAFLSGYDRRTQAVMLLSSLRMILLQNPYAKFVQPLLENPAEILEALQQDEALFEYYQDVIAWYQVAEMTTIDFNDNNLSHALIANMTLAVTLNRTVTLKVLSLTVEQPSVLFENLLIQALFLQLLDQKLTQGLPLEELLENQQQIFQQAEMIAKSKPRTAIEAIDKRLNEIHPQCFSLMAELQTVLKLPVDFKLVEETLEAMKQNLEQAREISRRDSAIVFQSQAIQQRDLDDLRQSVEEVYDDNVHQLRLQGIQLNVNYVAGMHEASRAHTRAHEHIMQGANATFQNLATVSAHTDSTRLHAMGAVSSRQAQGLDYFARAATQQNEYINYLSTLVERARQEREEQAEREGQMFFMVFGMAASIVLGNIIAPGLGNVLGAFWGKVVTAAFTSGVSAAISGQDNIPEAMLQGAFFAGFGHWMNTAFDKIPALQNFAEAYPTMTTTIQIGATAGLSSAWNGGNMAQSILVSMGTHALVGGMSARFATEQQIKTIPFQMFQAFAAGTLASVITGERSLGPNLLAGGIGALQTGASLLGENLSAKLESGTSLNRSLGRASRRLNTSENSLRQRPPLSQAPVSNKPSSAASSPEGATRSERGYPNGGLNSRIGAVQSELQAQDIKLSDEAVRSLIVQGTHPLDQTSTLPPHLRPARASYPRLSLQGVDAQSSTDTTLGHRLVRETLAFGRVINRKMNRDEAMQANLLMQWLNRDPERLMSAYRMINAKNKMLSYVGGKARIGWEAIANSAAAKMVWNSSFGKSMRTATAAGIQNTVSYIDSLNLTQEDREGLSGLFRLGAIVTPIARPGMMIVKGILPAVPNLVPKTITTLVRVPAIAVERAARIARSPVTMSITGAGIGIGAALASDPVQASGHNNTVSMSKDAAIGAAILGGGALYFMHGRGPNRSGSLAPVTAPQVLFSTPAPRSLSQPQPILNMFKKGRQDAGSGEHKTRAFKNPNHQYYPPPKKLPGFPQASRAKEMTPGNDGKLRKRWELQDGKILEWDRQHGELEMYSSNGDKHLGAFCYKTGRQLKEADKNRSIKQYVN